MNINSLISILNKEYDLSIQEEWDNSGYQIKNRKKDIKRIFVALDLTSENIDKAIAFDADLIITHHPLLFSSCKKINNDFPLGKKIIKAINSSISIYSMHTNYDKVQMSCAVAKNIKHKNYETLSDDGYGCILELDQDIKALDFANEIKNKFKLTDIRLYGDKIKKVRRIGILPGSGKSFIDEAVSKGCELFITGDIDYHTGIDYSEKGIVLLDCGHYGIEKFFIKDMCKYLKRNFSDIQIKSDAIKNPYVLI